MIPHDPVLYFESSHVITNNHSPLLSCPFQDWSSVSESAKDLIRGLLTQCPRKRLGASEVLEHPWMTQEVGCMSQSYSFFFFLLLQLVAFFSSP